MKNLLFVVLAAMVCGNVFGNGHRAGKHSVTIAGKINGLPATSAHYFSLFMMRKTPYVVQYGDIYKEIPIDAEGQFKVVLDSIDGACHIEMRFVDNAQQDQFFINRETLFVEPGDDLFIRGAWNTIKEGAPINADISGRGAAKFKCLQELDAAHIIKEGGVCYTVFDRKMYLGIPKLFGDSVFAPEMAILNKYKKQLTGEEYETIKANLEGLLFPMYGLRPNKKLDTDANTLALKKQGFAELQQWIQSIRPASESAICQSQYYIQFLLTNEETRVCLEDNTYEPDFSKMYHYLSTEFTGQLREKLLAAYLLDLEHDSVVPEVYDQLLKDAITLVHTDYIKEKLEFKSRLGKGSLPYDFRMPVDSSDRMLSLSDLKGNVVLIDEWAYACGGCVEFAHTFHNKVYSLFKDDPHFKVVSIFGSYGGSYGNKASYMRRLRNVDEDLKPCDPENSSTFPDYINLYGGDGVDKGAEKMNDYYRTHFAPFVMLVDKNGRIIASTATSFPVCNNEGSPNVQKLIDMIRQALADPGEKKKGTAVYITN